MQPSPSGTSKIPGSKFDHCVSPSNIFNFERVKLPGWSNHLSINDLCLKGEVMIGVGKHLNLSESEVVGVAPSLDSRSLDSIQLF